jgi:hypothetical protein
MAKKEAKEKAIEVVLWESANKLRGSMESEVYVEIFEQAENFKKNKWFA